MPRGSRATLHFPPRVDQQPQPFPIFQHHTTVLAAACFAHKTSQARRNEIMPSTIPYDPSLVLGNIVTKEKLDIVTAISAAQAPADAAEDTLNSLISLKRSIDMTVQELIEMNIDATNLIQESQETGKQITAAAVDYGKTKLAAEKAIQ